MQREILFKAKSLKGKWVYGDLIHGVGYKNGVHYILPREVNLAYIEDCHPIDGVQVFPETICQFTGLTDKNGNKIFEGDKVMVENKPYKSIEPIIVTWGKKSSGWTMKFHCEGWTVDKQLIKYYSLPSSKDIEIIGNIHD